MKAKPQGRDVETLIRLPRLHQSVEKLAERAHVYFTGASTQAQHCIDLLKPAEPEHPQERR